VTENERTEPVHFHPDLVADHLDTMATLVAFIHDNALSDLHGEKGDNSWVLGCAGFARSCAAIKKLADEKRFPWLTIYDSSMHFVFRIGAVAVRVCKGDEEGTPNGNALTRVGEETSLYCQTYLNGFYDPNYADCVWRFVIVKDERGCVSRVEFKLVRAVNNETAFTWLAPLQADISGLLSWMKDAAYVKLPAADVQDIQFGKLRKDKSAGGSA
jgi:hypothetical protein